MPRGAYCFRSGCLWNCDLRTRRRPNNIERGKAKQICLPPDQYRGRRVGTSEPRLSDLKSIPYPRHRQVRDRVASSLLGALLNLCARSRKRLSDHKSKETDPERLRNSHRSEQHASQASAETCLLERLPGFTLGTVQVTWQTSDGTATLCASC